MPENIEIEIVALPMDRQVLDAVKPAGESRENFAATLLGRALDEEFERIFGASKSPVLRVIPGRGKAA